MRVFRRWPVLLAFLIGALLVVVLRQEGPNPAPPGAAPSVADLDSAAESGSPARQGAGTSADTEPEPGGLEIQVTFAGAPAADASVRIWHNPDPSRDADRWMRPFRGTTDRAGSVRAPVSPGTYLLVATSAVGAAARQVVDHPRGGRWTRAEMTLEGTHVLSGRVVDVDGRTAIPHAALELTPTIPLRDARWRPSVPRDERVHATADAKGTFKLEALLPGTWRLDARAPGHAPAVLERVVVPALDEVVVKMQAAGFLSGFVRDETGRPVSGAQVSVDGTESAEPATTGEGGGFSIHVGPGMYRLRARSGERTGALGRWVSVAPRQTVAGLEILLGAPARVSGTVSDATTGAPIPSCQVAARQGEMRVDAACDEEGGFTVAALSAGSVDVVVRADGYAEENLKNLVVAAGEAFAVDVKLAGTARVEGTVRRPDGSPFPQVLVRANGFPGPGRGAVPVLTNEVGGFRLDDVPAGQVTVLAWREGSVAGAQTIISLQKGETARVDLTLSEAGVIQGRVRRADNQPLDAHTEVQVRRRDDRGQDRVAPTAVAPDGSYKVAVPEGAWLITAARRGSAAWNFMHDAVPVDVEGGKTVQQDLVVEGETYACDGVVLEPGGASAGKAAVQTVGELRQTSGTDAAGRFAIVVSPGRTPKIEKIRARKGGRYGEAMVKDSCRDVVVQLREPARLTGEVRDSSGRAVDGYELTVGFAGDTFSWWRRLETYRFHGSRYALEDVPASQLEVEVVTADGRRALGSVTLGPGQHGMLDLTLVPESRVEGRVLGAKTRQPLPHARVRLLTGAATPIPAAADGTFVIPRLSAGTHKFFAVARGHKAVHKEVALSEGEVLRLGDILLEAERVEPGSVGAHVGTRDGKVFFLTGVLAKGPAEQAGLREHDRLLALDGVSVRSARDGSERLFGMPGSTVTIEIERAGERRSVVVTRAR